MFPTMAIEHPDGTVAEVPALRSDRCRRWPWLYRKLPNGAKVPVDYDNSPEAERQRRPDPFTYTIGNWGVC